MDTLETTTALEATERFVGDLNEKFADEQQVYEIDGVGRRYIRVMSYSAKYLREGETPQRSVYLFVDRDNGDLLMPAGLKGPAKHARGSLLLEGGYASALANADRFGGFLYLKR